MKTVPQQVKQPKNDSYSNNQTEILSEYCGGCITTDEERCDFCIKNTWLYEKVNGNKELTS